MCSDIGQSIDPIGFHKTEDASDWSVIKQHCIVMKGLTGVHLQSYRRDFRIYRKEGVLFQLKIRGASENLKTSRGPY
jgi:hypothetical protein